MHLTTCTERKEGEGGEIAQQTPDGVHELHQKKKSPVSIATYKATDLLHSTSVYTLAHEYTH